MHSDLIKIFDNYFSNFNNIIQKKFNLDNIYLNSLKDDFLGIKPKKEIFQDFSNKLIIKKINDRFSLKYNSKNKNAIEGLSKITDGKKINSNLIYFSGDYENSKKFFIQLQEYTVNLFFSKIIKHCKHIFSRGDKANRFCNNHTDNIFCKFHSKNKISRGIKPVFYEGESRQLKYQIGRMEWPKITWDAVQTDIFQYGIANVYNELGIHPKIGPSWCRWNETLGIFTRWNINILGQTECARFIN